MKELGNVHRGVCCCSEESAREVYRQHDVGSIFRPRVKHPVYLQISATTTTQTQLSEHARKAVDKISPEKDVSNLSSSIPRSLASAIPKPILYHNYSVGECADLIFGVSLVDYATARCLADGEIPKIVQICIREVDLRGLECEGIYRVGPVCIFRSASPSLSTGVGSTRNCTISASIRSIVSTHGVYLLC